jgi:uncharacterized protein YhfF
MGETYLTSIGESLESIRRTYKSWYFCDNEKDANKLADLVVAGIKRGTAGLLDLYLLDNEDIPKLGEYSIVTNWDGIAKCVIKTKKIHSLPFNEVDEHLVFI